MVAEAQGGAGRRERRRVLRGWPNQHPAEAILEWVEASSYNSNVKDTGPVDHTSSVELQTIPRRASRDNLNRHLHDWQGTSELYGANVTKEAKHLRRGGTSEALNMDLKLTN